jgi:adenylate kinase
LEINAFSSFQFLGVDGYSNLDHMATGNLSDDAVAYLQEHKVEALFESLLHDLLIGLPAKPLDHLLGLLGTLPTPKIVIAGPPAGGKGTQCQQIVERFGVVHISTGDILRDHTQRGTEFGKKASEFMSKGMLVPDDLIISLVKDRLSQDDVAQRGWLLDGFPRTRSQAISLQTAGIIPNALIVLDVSDSVVVNRIAGRRTDPATGAVYHTTANPPPAGLHVIQRADDTEEAITVRLRLFHANLHEVLACYRSIAVHINGEQDKDVVAAEVIEQLEHRIVLV